MSSQVRKHTRCEATWGFAKAKAVMREPSFALGSSQPSIWWLRYLFFKMHLYLPHAAAQRWNNAVSKITLCHAYFCSLA